MKLGEEELAQVHRTCVSVTGDAASFDEWLTNQGIDSMGLLENARLGGLAWALYNGGDLDAYMTAIVAGFEWGYRARQTQELDDE